MSSQSPALDRIAAEVLAELHAGVRTFRSSKGALLWYRGELLRRLRASPNLSVAGTGGGERDDATFAAVAACLARHHAADLDPGGLAYTPNGRWRSQPAWGPGEAVLWLTAWYENTSDDGADMALDAGLEERPPRRDHDGSFLALKAGLERRTFHRRCRSTARKLRLRLVYARIVLESES